MNNLLDYEKSKSLTNDLTHNINIYYDKFDNDQILNEYFNSCCKFTYSRDNVGYLYAKDSAKEIIIGALLISLLVVNNSFVLDKSFKHYNKDLKFSKNKSKNLTEIINRIKYDKILRSADEYDGCVIQFVQAPFLLGLGYIFDDFPGTCQDITLCKIYKQAYNNNLRGFTMSKTHWDAKGEDDYYDDEYYDDEYYDDDFDDFDRTTSYYSGFVSFGEKHALPTNSFYTCPRVIKHLRYNRALIYFGITLSHVYRHVVNEENKENGVIFKNNFVETIINMFVNFIDEDRCNYIENSFINLYGLDCFKSYVNLLITRDCISFNRERYKKYKGGKKTYKLFGKHKYNGKMRNIYKYRNTFYIKNRENIYTKISKKDIS